MALNTKDLEARLTELMDRWRRRSEMTDDKDASLCADELEAALYPAGKDPRRGWKAR